MAGCLPTPRCELSPSCEPLPDQLLLSWMFADACTGDIAQHNPLRWSDKMGFKHALADVEAQNANFARPIRVREYEHSSCRELAEYIACTHQGFKEFHENVLKQLDAQLDVSVAVPVHPGGCAHGLAVPTPALIPFLQIQAQPATALMMIEGKLVDYWSKSWGCWVPAAIAAVDSDSGLLQLDVKAGVWMSIATSHLRPRTRPSQVELERIRDILCEGRIEQEASKLFICHAGHADESLDAALQELTPMDIHGYRWKSIDISAAVDLGIDVDKLLGVVGSLMWLKQEMSEARNGTLSIDRFTSLLCKKLGAVYVEYGQAVNPGYSAPRRFEDPQDVYMFEKKLGDGTFGAVFLARQLDCQSRKAVKMLKKQPAGMANTELEQEIGHLCALDHPHIVKLYEYFESSDYIYLVMDFCPGGDLQELVNKAKAMSQRINENFVSSVMQQVLMAIAHAHSRGIMHLDLKPGNVMLTPSRGTLTPAGKCRDGPTMGLGQKPHAMVIDLGVARIFQAGDNRAYAPCGTPNTMAPEVWRGELTPKADVFSMGVMLFELLSNSLPFEGIPYVPADSLRYWGFTPEMGAPEVAWEKLGHACPHARFQCRHMLAFSRHQRPTASMCLRMPFFVTNTVSQVAVGAAMPAMPSLATGVSPEIVERISKVHLRTALQRSVALAIARRWPSNQLPSIKQAFETLDVAGVGQLQKGRLQLCLGELGIDCGLAREIAEAMDLDRDGVVDWTEFVAACIEPGCDLLEDDLHQLFELADKDGDGLLNVADLSTLLASEHLRSAEAICDGLQGMIDTRDASARVDWRTFRKYFRSPSNIDNDICTDETDTTDDLLFPYGALTQLEKMARNMLQQAQDTLKPRAKRLPKHRAPKRHVER